MWENSTYGAKKLCLRKHKKHKMVVTGATYTAQIHTRHSTGRTANINTWYAFFHSLSAANCWHLCCYSFTPFVCVVQRDEAKIILKKCFIWVDLDSIFDRFDPGICLIWPTMFCPRLTRQYSQGMTFGNEEQLSNAHICIQWLHCCLLKDFVSRVVGIIVVVALFL